MTGTNGGKVEWRNTVFQGDAQDVLTEYIPDNSVELVVTSPPYWDIKDYGMDDQIGYGDDLNEYIREIGHVVGECIRALKPGCRLALNIGDQFISSEGEGPYRVEPLNSRILHQVMHWYGDEIVPLGSIIWNKITNTETSGGASVMGTYGRPRGGIVDYHHEYINLFRKAGEPPEPKDGDRISSEEWKTLFDGIWTIPGEAQDDHPAPFPEEIPRRLIKMFSFSGDTVLDPFVGKGTTAYVAKEMNRNYVGVDLNPEYVAQAQENVGTAVDVISELDESKSQRMQEMIEFGDDVEF